MKRILQCALLLSATMSMAQSITLNPFATGFNSPVEIARSTDNRLYVVEQGGTIRVLDAEGNISQEPLLDISSLTVAQGERGLLGLAFHPDYAANGYFYVYYTNLQGDSVLSRYTRSVENPEVADPGSGQILFTIDQPFDNHNGGCLRFGPDDGYLYIATGDGGSGGDPNNNAQNINSLLGKMLRIDVDVVGQGTYTSPATNPFTNTDGADEIWAYGLRNPWKFSFNRLTGDLWIADVGQGEIEEINMVEGSEAGVNYGWRCFEGTQEYNPDGCTMTEAMTPPVAEYNHDNGGCSVTGGFVYTGTLYEGMAGKYVFSDYCNGRIGMANTDGTVTWSEVFEGSFATLGEDNEGELYVASITDGVVYKIAYGTPSSTDGVQGNTITLYPNPAKENINVKTIGVSLPLQVRIYDLSGKLLLEQEITAAEAQLNISPLTTGIYFAEISGSSGTNRQKIVVQ